MCDCLRRLWNATSPQGTTAFERIFLAQQPWSSLESIRVVAKVQDGDRDFSIDEVRANAALALREHPRLSEVITDTGLWKRVDVDLANHIVSVRAEEAKASGDGAEEEPDGLCAALADMPAFRMQGRPLWQIVVSPRKIVLDIHHGLVDGVGLAVICASLFQGRTMSEANEDICSRLGPKLSALAGQGCFQKFLVWLKSLFIILWYLTTPVLGLIRPEPKSAVFAQGQPKTAARLIHLGPYELAGLQRAARGHGKLNDLLIHTISQGVHSYCHAEDGAAAALPGRMAVPVSFKVPDLSDPQRMRANNAFATVAVAVPSPSAGSRAGAAGARVSASEALAARNAQVLLSLLPLPVIRWLYLTSSRLFTFCLSNVDASWAGTHFTPAEASSAGLGASRRIHVHGYGAPPGDISLFILVNSHGPNLHVGITAGSYIRDPVALAQKINAEIRRAVSESIRDESVSASLLPQV
jgi:hypothetical protein